ncbi:ethanolamine utilization protein [Cucurbitaria berberidis CBS 394.84]|uniref:Ethanolamine utilization protein n=1 Tax=Cucurbitaria berberidis CBS 394.84 TaxID=1168544 RepID=A0A9P4LDA0_9PLEO|nr:ethanolamine utilization protein [Cucurbitaria berberidis CBS 394.84]KAF1851631.1 ethanolamine utilization protein [Cucurbitaria berberidis CBS 394.84]
MPFDTLSESQFHHIPHLEGGPPEVYFVDRFGTPKGPNTENPLTGSMFLLEYAEVFNPPPKYMYDESGVVIKGQLIITDESGKTATCNPGDTFFIHRGSTITFSTPKFAVAYKVAARWKDAH